jgi:hypothetical protein
MRVNAAHFFVSNEDSKTVARGLKAIRRFAHRWNPRYKNGEQVFFLLSLVFTGVQRLM